MYAGVYIYSICRNTCSVIKKNVVGGGANFDFRDVFSRFQCCERANCLVQENYNESNVEMIDYFFSFYFDLE